MLVRVYFLIMKSGGRVYLHMKSKKDYDLARRTVDETARRNRITARAIVSQRPPIRQIELIDTSVAIAISLFGGVAAPSIISFISEVASRLRRRYHSITICTELAEVIGREVVTRFAEPRATVRLMSLAELA